jgi:hypothetical protein
MLFSPKSELLEASFVPNPRNLRKLAGVGFWTLVQESLHGNARMSWRESMHSFAKSM